MDSLLDPVSPEYGFKKLWRFVRTVHEISEMGRFLHGRGSHFLQPGQVLEERCMIKAYLHVHFFFYAKQNGCVCGQRHAAKQKSTCHSLRSSYRIIHQPESIFGNLRTPFLIRSRYQLNKGNLVEVTLSVLPRNRQ
jgi:hypothetical protein